MQSAAEISKPLWKFCNLVELSCSTLAEAVELWVNLPESYQQHKDWKRFDDLMMSDAALLVHCLDPRYRGRNLTLQRKKTANVLFLELLQGDDLIGFIDHRDGKNSFSHESLEKLSPVNYWSFFKNEYKKLADIGRKYISLPASVFSLRETNLNSESLSKSQSEKLKFLSKALKVVKA